MSPRRAPTRSTATPIVTLLTDFGGRDGYAGILHGVILGHEPRARIVDLSHDVAAQDVRGGALVLESAVAHFPRGTIHLAVVDPGVGGERRAVAVETDEFFLVGPDNGLLALAAARAKSVKAIVDLEAPTARDGLSRTFHGRDLFAPIAARLASGVAIAECGPAGAPLAPLDLPEPRHVDGSVVAQVIHVDHFGNLVLNLRASDLDGFRGEDLSVTLGGVQIERVSTHYAAVREGRPVLVWNSWGRLEIAVRNGSAARHLRASVGDRAEIRRIADR